MRFNREIYPGRGLGVWAFWLHRLSGLAIIFYLLMHILVISTIVGGQANFNSAMTFLKVADLRLARNGLDRLHHASWSQWHPHCPVRSGHGHQTAKRNFRGHGNRRRDSNRHCVCGRVAAHRWIKMVNSNW